MVLCFIMFDSTHMSILHFLVKPYPDRREASSQFHKKLMGVVREIPSRERDKPRLL